MTEAERLARAKEWHQAASERRAHALENLEHENPMMADAFYRTADYMLDRMQVIEALFPEIQTT